MSDCPCCVADEIYKSLTRRKYFNPEWLQCSHRAATWKILECWRNPWLNYAVILAEHRDQPGEYVVFTQTLAPRAIPSDKFFGSLKSAKNFYRRELKRIK